MSAALSPPRHHETQNPALLPGRLLAQRALWQPLANSLPVGAVLVVLPLADSPQRRALLLTAVLLKAAGHQVTTIPVETFAGRAVQARLALDA
jgi:hypothetical protein